FHRAGWKTVLERAFGHRTFFLYARQDGEIVGVLPLAQIKSALFGNTLASLPFCVYGGIVADSDEVALALREEACRLAQQRKVDALELRNMTASNAGWPVKELYYTFRKAIDASDEVNLKAIPNRQRAMVRKGLKEGLSSEWDAGVERLYRVYSESVRNLGTPVFSSKYLRILREVFGDDCSVLMIKHQGQDVAAVMSFYFRDEVIPYYGGSTSVARTIKGVNHVMYWELMRYSAEQGYRVFDFGRSKAGTGPYSFKKNFGFEPQPLPYEYYLVTSTSVPDVNPLNPKYRLMINVWSRLPLPVANFMGPFLARSLG
ncbi:MAG: FemAB family PEP-CTERM system-associated protein, partial [Halioglobus sp.]|nr:FemAB family PEP-CTERM system-associated protein [Halioglobus sp.]